jgi:HD-GYP domain-containing protein (c-di-GMP phosphodiesterase class II)
MDEIIEIPITELKIGHYVMLPFGWKDHPFLFSSFRIKDDKQLHIIRNLGLRLVKVNLKKSLIGFDIQPDTIPVNLDAGPPEPEVIIPPKADPEKEEQKAARRSIRQAERAFSNAVSPLRDSIARLNLKPDEGLATVADLIRTSATALTRQSEPVGFHLVRSIQNGDSLLLHSLNVAYIAMLIAREAGWPPLAIQDAGLAGLVHDIGELKIPTTVTRKKTPMTKAEINYLKLHPQYGFEQLTQLKAFSKEVREATLQHHEYMDGSGYPNQLRGNQISSLARLIAVVEFYEEKLHPRNGVVHDTPNKVISDLFKKHDKEFDSQFSQLLVKVLGVYPPGTVVKLDDDTLALVMSSSPLSSLKPTILPYEKGRKPESAILINLLKDPRTIQSSVAIEKLSSQQQQYFGLTKHACYYFTLQPDD